MGHHIMWEWMERIMLLEGVHIMIGGIRFLLQDIANSFLVGRNTVQKWGNGAWMLAIGNALLLRCYFSSCKDVLTHFHL